jgi:cysteine desulfurase
MPTDRVYLDHNATTPIRPEAMAAVVEALASGGNPSSVHQDGRQARAAVETARDAVAALAGAPSDGVVFTSGGTEANHLALAASGADRILVSAIEHDSVLAAARLSGLPVETMAVTVDGSLDLDDLTAKLGGADRRTLVSVMAANNETGVVQPIDAVVDRARSAGAMVHCDAVQAAGKIPLDFTSLGLDFMTLSGHKVGGPAGSGALMVAGRAEVRARQGGGGQERGRRAGTENLSGIAGFGAAARIVADSADGGRLAALRDKLEARLSAVAEDAVIFGAKAPRLGNTSAIAMPGVSSELQVMALDLAGIAVSAGAACSSGKVRASHVLQAMGFGTGYSDCAIRISLGWTTTAADIDRLVAAWTELYRRKRAA